MGPANVEEAEAEGAVDALDDAAGWVKASEDLVSAGLRCLRPRCFFPLVGAAVNARGTRKSVVNVAILGYHRWPALPLVRVVLLVGTGALTRDLLAGSR